MDRLDSLGTYAQLLRLLSDTSLRLQARRAHRAGLGEDLAVIRVEFKRRRQVGSGQSDTLAA
jgi:hypothetical protein